MAIPIRGNKEVDEIAEQKSKEACQYLKENLKQLGEPVIRTLLLLFDEASVGLRAGLEVRLKQEIGGKYSAGFKELKERVESLETRLNVLDSQGGHGGQPVDTTQQTVDSSNAVPVN